MVSRIADANLEILFTPGARAFRRPAAVLFVHGAYHGAWSYAGGWMPFFAERGFDAYALSLRGHGESAGRESVKRASLEDFRSDVRATVDRIGGPVILVGHSMGAMVVQKYLERESVAAAVLMCVPTARDLMLAAWPLLRRFTWPTLKYLISGNPDFLYHSRRACRELLFNGDTSVEAEHALDRIAAQPESRRAYREFLSHRVRPAGANQPVLYIGAENDISISKASFARQAAWYGADLKMYPEKSHELLITPGWEQIAADVASWLEIALQKAVA